MKEVERTIEALLFLSGDPVSAQDLAAAAEVEPDDEEAYLLAGDAYEQAGEPAEAIKYYNGYLEREPKGETSKQVEARISALLEGGESNR